MFQSSYPADMMILSLVLIPLITPLIMKQTQPPYISSTIEDSCISYRTLHNELNIVLE